MFMLYMPIPASIFEEKYQLSGSLNLIFKRVCVLDRLDRTVQKLRGRCVSPTTRPSVGHFRSLAGLKGPLIDLYQLWLASAETIQNLILQYLCREGQVF